MIKTKCIRGKLMKNAVIFFGAIVLCCGCETKIGRVAALDDKAWEESEWISAADARVTQKDSELCVSSFLGKFKNEGTVKSAKWMTTGLGAYNVWVNGISVGAEDFLKPGFTHVQKTRRSFTYDVTKFLKTGKGETNVLAAEVASSWWSDRITGFRGKKCAFRAVLEVVYADGTVKRYGTNTNDWKAGVCGPVVSASIFQGEVYDARIERPLFECEKLKRAELNKEFGGRILPTDGAEICLRLDKLLKPVEAYVWKGVEGGGNGVFGRVKKLREIPPEAKEFSLAAGETLVVDFGQNCAGVPAFTFKADQGTVLTCLPAEMLNDANGERSRGNDGPGGSVYRENLRMHRDCMRLVYTFGAQQGETEGFVSYMPSYTFFGYRYISVTASADVVFRSVASVPVSSITPEMETGSLETGVPELNRLVSNIYWGQLSNYLSVPTDCPQRNERLGWTADTQIFCEAGSFNADTRKFLGKWMQDLCDNQHPLGGFSSAAPLAFAANTPMRFGWADAGVIVPYQIWKQFGDVAIIKKNWSAMERFMARVNATKHDTDATRGENSGYQYADWVSFEDLETYSSKAWSGRVLRPEAKLYWNYLGAVYWYWDALLMEKMALAIGVDSAKYVQMAKDAKAYLAKNFFSQEDGQLLPPMRNMQTPVLFALKLKLVEGKAKEDSITALRRNFAEHGDCLQTGFLGTSILMETLSENGMTDIAYTLLLQRKNPSWLYSVDQGATTIWERWNSYTKERGFGPVGMNSFNHYAYGVVLAWMYKDMAGIAADENAPGFKNIIMAPKPDRRVGFVKARYKSAAGIVKSAWRYEGDEWIWEFTIPEGATADVMLPGESLSKKYKAGEYRIVMEAGK